MKLSGERVEAILRECLYRDEEIPDGKPPPGTVLVEGLTRKFGLHPGRLAEHATEIVALLDELPDAFHEKRGGGWSFLNACIDKHGEQWTDFHRRMEELFVLGMAIKRVRYCLPRELWSSLPGGVPYVVVTHAPLA